MADRLRWKLHRIHVQHGRNVTAIRERIERVLGVTTTAKPEGGPWGIYFQAPADVNLDFLRPDVLPPELRLPKEQT